MNNCILNKLIPLLPRFELLDVQQHWNVLENVIIDVTDEIVPMIEFLPKMQTKLATNPAWVNHKINIRKRLLKADKLNNNQCLWSFLNIYFCKHERTKINNYQLKL